MIGGIRLFKTKITENLNLKMISMEGAVPDSGDEGTSENTCSDHRHPSASDIRTKASAHSLSSTAVLRSP